MEVKQRYLIAGSSFVKRLEDHCRSHWTIKKRQVEFVGIPGGTISRLQASLRNVQRNANRIRMVVLSIGSNDLCDARRSPVDVSNQLLDLAHQLISYGIMKVVICQLLHRSSCSHFTMGMDIPEFNNRIDEVNTLLSQKQAGGIIFWKHNQCVLGAHRLSGDGVHLSRKAVKSYARSIFQAIMEYD